MQLQHSTLHLDYNPLINTSRAGPCTIDQLFGLGCITPKPVFPLKVALKGVPPPLFVSHYGMSVPTNSPCDLRLNCGISENLNVEQGG